MPRYARMLSEGGLYHIMIRGNERKEIFFDDEDRNRFLDTVQRMKENNEYQVHAYCLMTNHVHLLLREGKDSIQRTMKRIGVSYSHYFNKKYDRVGHLFQDRYRSENIDGDAYFLAAVRYIHNNPVKAGIVEKAEDYQWSSYGYYLGKNKSRIITFDTAPLLEIFSRDERRALAVFIEFSEQSNEDNFIDYRNEEVDGKAKGINLIEVVRGITEKHGIEICDVKKINNRILRNQIIHEIKNESGGSVREISRILGISKDIVFRA